MDWPTRVGAGPKVLADKPVIKGTRIAVELVLDLLAAGYTSEQIRQQYDQLPTEDVPACLAYACEIVGSERMFAVKR